MNLMESLVNEIERNAKLVEIYHSIGSEGSIGATLIQMDIDKAKASIQSGDIVEMIRAHETLKDNEE